MNAWRRQPIAVVAEHRRHPNGPGNLRHVARLAAPPFAGERAVAPLLIVHLLGQRTDDAAVRTEGFGDERVAGRAELRLPDVLALHLLEPGHRVHDAPAACVGRERTERAARAGRQRRGQREIAVESFARSEPVGGDLVTDGARHAVRGRGRRAPTARSTARRTGARTPSRVAPGRPRGGSRRRHVARRAFVLDGRASIPGGRASSRRTLAWKYGSRAELAIIVPRQLAPIDTSSPTR